MGVRHSSSSTGPTGVSTARFVALLAATLAAVCAMLAGGASPVAAQENSLNELIPENGAVLSEAPTEVALGFDQPIQSDQTVSVEVTCGGEQLSFGAGEFNDNATSVAFPIESDVPRGACIIQWTLTEAENASPIDSGRSTFTVGEESAADTESTTTSAPATTAPPAEQVASGDTDGETSHTAVKWFGRLVSTMAIMMIFGGLVVISSGWPEGPEYLVTLNFFRLIWVVSLIGTAIFIIAYAAEHAGTGLVGGLNPLNWLNLVNDGWTGIGAVMRLIAVVAAGYVTLYPERILDPATAMWAWLIPGAAVVALAFGRVEGQLALIGLVVTIVHVVAAAAWLGGTALIARVVLAGPGEEDLVVSTRTFARYSIAAIAVTVITGVIEMIRLVGGALFSTGHGRVMLLKVLAVAAMLFIAMAARQQLGQRLARSHEMTAVNADRFRRAFGAETAIGIIVLAFSSWALTMDAGNTVPWNDETYTREIPYAAAEPVDLDATVFIGPAQVGANGFLVQVENPPEGITDLKLRFVPPAGTQNGEAWIIEQEIPLTGSGSVWRPTENGVPFDVPGTWRLELSATTADGVVPAIPMTFLVDNADGSTPSSTTTEPAATDPSANTEVLEETSVTGEIVTTTTTTPSTTTTEP